MSDEKNPVIINIPLVFHKRLVCAHAFLDPRNRPYDPI